MVSATITWTGPFHIKEMSGCFSFLIFMFQKFLCFVEISELNANSVDSDQTPHSAASDLGLHCLLMSLLWTLDLNGLKARLEVKICTDSDSSRACGNSHPGVCSPSIHSIISNDFVSGL